jgi:hypothetical protein
VRGPDRKDVAAGYERARIKPFQAMKGDLERVLGGPAPLARGAFGEEQANPDPFENHYNDKPAGGGKTKPTDVNTWFSEPRSGALEVYSIVEAAFPACAAYAEKNGALSAAPTAESAPAQCAAMARAFWSRTASPVEIEPCVRAATTGAESEPDPKKKWAWGCTTLVVSANFVSY